MVHELLGKAVEGRTCFSRSFLTSWNVPSIDSCLSVFLIYWYALNYWTELLEPGSATAACSNDPKVAGFGAGPSKMCALANSDADVGVSLFVGCPRLFVVLKGNQQGNPPNPQTKDTPMFSRPGSETYDEKQH